MTTTALLARTALSTAYGGADHGAIWWSVGLLVLALTTFGLMALFLAGATHSYARSTRPAPRDPVRRDPDRPQWH